MRPGNISFDGIPLANLVHGLYHGTRAQGMGVLHDKSNLSVLDVEGDLRARPIGPELYIDYYRGRPLKVNLDVAEQSFNPRLYDRDAGPGAGAAVIAKLREQFPAPIDAESDDAGETRKMVKP